MGALVTRKLSLVCRDSLKMMGCRISNNYTGGIHVRYGIQQSLIMVEVLIVGYSEMDKGGDGKK